MTVPCRREALHVQPEGPRPRARLAGAHRGRPRDPARRADAAVVLHGRRPGARARRVPARRRRPPRAGPAPAVDPRLLRVRAARPDGARVAWARRARRSGTRSRSSTSRTPPPSIGPEDEIPYPAGTEELDYELELAAVIGADGQIAGFTVMNDWSARDLQRAEMKVGLGPSKGKDFATSLGPVVVTPTSSTARAGTMVARVNGEERSRGSCRGHAPLLAGDPRPRGAEHAAAARRHPRLGHGRHRLHPRARRRPLAPSPATSSSSRSRASACCATPSGREPHRRRYPPVMPFYQRLGDVPRKRHIQFRDNGPAADGGGLRPRGLLRQRVDPLPPPVAVPRPRDRRVRADRARRVGARRARAPAPPDLGRARRRATRSPAGGC